MTEEEQEPLPDNAPPQGATDAVLKASDPVPVDSQPVQGIDFNKHADSPITVAGMVAGMATMGFQASAVAEAARVVDEMVGELKIFLRPEYCFAIKPKHYIR